MMHVALLSLTVLAAQAVRTNIVTDQELQTSLNAEAEQQDTDALLRTAENSAEALATLTVESEVPGIRVDSRGQKFVTDYGLYREHMSSEIAKIEAEEGFNPKRPDIIHIRLKKQLAQVDKIIAKKARVEPFGPFSALGPGGKPKPQKKGKGCCCAGTFKTYLPCPESMGPAPAQHVCNVNAYDLDSCQDMDDWWPGHMCLSHPGGWFEFDKPGGAQCDALNGETKKETYRPSKPKGAARVPAYYSRFVR